MGALCPNGPPGRPIVSEADDAICKYRFKRIYGITPSPDNKQTDEKGPYIGVWAKLTKNWEVLIETLVKICDAFVKREQYSVQVQ